MISTESLLALEFDRIREIAKSLAASALGAERLTTLAPSERIEEAKQVLTLTGEMVRLLREATGEFPIHGLADIREELKRSAVEGMALEPASMLRIASTVHTAGELKKYLKSRRQNAPRLFDFAEGISTFDPIEKRIADAVETDGTIKDDASHELKSIRQTIHREQRHLEERLQKILGKWSAAGYLQDEMISYRGGKLALPVREEMRGRVQGMVVDQSSSGATVFMEPVETLEISNKVRQLEIDETREIHRILMEITSLVRESLPELAITLEILGELDEYYARGRLALRWDGVEPELNSSGMLRILNGRHPLLLERLKSGVVPLSLEIKPPTRTLVISGPNAGGKTVTLKTIGLFCTMAAAGLFVPAAPGTELPFFAGIHADIGDSQSLESDLSTFTAHVGKLKQMVMDSNKPKLILVDEIGSSTDPAVGAALGQSVLLELTRQQAISIVTTHHGGLKAFAHETDGMENGSMAFDETSLVPTYVYRAGVPGSSYALEIAARVGFPNALLERAQGYLGKGLMGLEELVGELSRKIEEYEKSRRQSDLKLNEYASLQKLYEERVGELKKVKAETKKQALAEADFLLQRANREFEAAIKEIKEQSASSAAIKSARERLSTVRQEVEKTQREVDKVLAPPQPTRIRLEKAAVGDRVEVEDMQGIQGAGTVTSIQKHGKRAEVEIGGVRLWVDANKLFAAAEVNRAKPKRVEMKIELNQSYVPMKLDLRGKYGDEALPELDSYLATAAEMNYPEVQIIHGKGTGALRVKVREFLDTHPLVKSYHDGGPNSDDFGCTVVELK